MTSYAGVFYVGVTTLRGTSTAAQSLVMTTTGSTATNSTISRLAGVSAGTVEIHIGGQMLPTAMQDPNISVQVFDSTIVGAEADSANLVRKAQDLFNDPDRFLALGEIDSAYRDAFVRFKAGITHCAISVMRISVT